MKGLKLKYTKKNKIQKFSIKTPLRKKCLSAKKYNYFDLIHYTPKFPNIFYINDVKNTFTSMELFLRKKVINDLFEVLKVKEYEKYFLLDTLREGQKLYNDFIKNIKKYNNKIDNKALWKISTISPDEISNLISKFQNAEEIKAIEIFKEFTNNNNEIIIIIKNFSANYFLYKEDNTDTYKYIYFSKKGLRYVDSFLYSNVIKATEDFKQISYETKMFSELCKKIFESLKEYTIIKEDLNRDSLFKNLIKIGNEFFSENLFPQILKVILTEVLQANNHIIKKNKSDENSVESSLENPNNTWIKLLINNKALNTTIGKIFFQIVIKFNKNEDKKFLTKKLKRTKNISKNNKNARKDFLINCIERILKDIINQFKKTDSYKKYLHKASLTHEMFIKNTEEIYIKYTLNCLKGITIAEKLLDFNLLEDFIINFLTPIEKGKDQKNNIIHKIPTQNVSNDILMLLFVIKYECLNSNNLNKEMGIQISSNLLTILNHYISTRVAIYEHDMGEFIIKLSENMLFHIDKQNNVYMNDAFYYSTRQPEIFPSFGPYNIDLTLLKERSSKNHRIILESYLKSNQVNIRYAPKFKVKAVANSNIEDQLNHGNTLFCKLSLQGIDNFVTSILSLLKLSDEEFQAKCEENWTFFRFFVPKDTDITFMKKQFNIETFTNIMRVITNMKTKTEFYNKNVKIDTKLKGLQLTKFLEATSTIKFEFRRILLSLLFLLSFDGWYPKLWVDARGRQYPNESVLNNIKAPKFRTLFYYVPSHANETLGFTNSINNDIEQRYDTKDALEHMVKCIVKGILLTDKKKHTQEKFIPKKFDGVSKRTLLRRRKREKKRLQLLEQINSNHENTV